MREYPLLIIGGGLSGLASGIRYARFGQKVLILEKHSKIGGLNSYYQRRGRLLETGLHAVTNFAPPEDKKAPLNRLLRQLKIPRRTLTLQEQFGSEILFPDRASLSFSNDMGLLLNQVAKVFPESTGQFNALISELDRYDPFTPCPAVSARGFVSNFIDDRLLVEMLFCPLMFYGGSQENDMDLSQFVIMFRAVLQEGFFRPQGTIRDFLSLLLNHYREFGGEIELSTGVREIITQEDRVIGVRTEKGEEIFCDSLISTAGFPETRKLFQNPDAATAFSKSGVEELSGRLSFVESIYILDRSVLSRLRNDRTIIFYNLTEKFAYRRPDQAVDLNSGVICFPGNFHGTDEGDTLQLRVTHLANYDMWRDASSDRNLYTDMKKHWTEESKKVIGKIVGNYSENIVYEDTFTPVTVERFTARSQGAVYGSPEKVKDGGTSFENLFIAGTDQGYLGIVGSLLSGVTMVNQHVLNKT